MTDRTKQKYQITDLLITTLKAKGLPLKSEVVDIMIPFYWHAGRSGRSLRLTTWGRSAFTAAEIKGYDFPISNAQYVDKTSMNILNESSKKISCPYYFWLKTDAASNTAVTHVASVTVYDEKIAIMISIYGCLLQFLENSGVIDE